MKTCLQYTLYPLLMTSGLIGVWVCLQQGWHPAVVATAITALGILAIMLMEFILPFDRAIGMKDSEWTIDLKHLIVTQAILPKIFLLLWTYLIVLISSEFTQIQYLKDFWPRHWSLFQQFLLLLPVLGFGRYWAHRWGHEVPFLWAFHEIHHSTRRLYWLNASRWNPFDKALVSAPELIPLILLGISPEVVALYTIFMSLNSLMQHANVDIKLGWLNYLFNVNESHRWHHSTRVSESNNNYGNPLAIWDIAFGTFYLPQDRRAPAATGVTPKHYSKGYLDDLTRPFRQLLKSSKSPSKSSSVEASESLESDAVTLK